MEFLKIENLCKTYGKGENAVKALNNVSFTIPKGQMVAVIGASGSGKSTLLHILGGVDRPTSGKVWLDGQDVYAQNNKNLAIFRRRQVGLIYQFYNLIPVLTAEENITLPMIMDGRKPKKERVEEILSLLDLKERRHHLPSQLSGGQQQRVSIGRALFTSPNVILADEPTGNLDSKNSAEIIALLRKSNKEFNQTMIIITHDENIALQCDRILTLSDGKIVSDALTHQS
ncbi:MAG: ABC transporter ATP-binding protein [Ruminococcus sp.]|nr:ABC transporter ATP-binding protein [Ruminococcus sp.]